MQNKVPQSIKLRTRILLASLLAAVLLFVLMPSGKSANALPPISTAAPVSPSVPSGNGGSKAPETNSALQLASLPAVDLPRILALNPFRNEASATPDVQVSVADKASTRPNPSSRDPQSSSSTSAAGIDGTAVAKLLIDSTSGDEPGLRVSAVITGSHRPAALIGNKIYFENDEVTGGWVVSSIRPEGVSFARHAATH